MSEIFDSCIAGKRRSKFSITGSTISKYIISPFLVWCDAFAPPEARDPENRYMHLLFERGIKHEKVVVDEMFDSAEKLQFKTFEDGFRMVLDACSKGAQTISNAPLFFLPEDVYGIADVLERRLNHSSVFGDFYYVVKEIKSAKHIKDKNILQAAFYNYVLGKIQGYFAPKFYLINRDSEEFEFSYEDYHERVLLCIADIRAIFNGKEVSATMSASQWPWESYVKKCAVDANDVSVLPYVGGVVKQQLNDVGVFTVSDLASKDVVLDIPVLEKIKLYAKSWVEKKPIVISKPSLPKSECEIFLDFEGTDDLESDEGFIKVTYLIGLLVDGRYKSFVAENLADEGRMFHAFLAFMKKQANFTIYHYGYYEKTHLKSLGEKYGVDVSHLLDNMVDLLSVVRKCVALPVVSFSLKEVGKYLGFSWRGMADAQESIVLYLNFLDSREREVLKRILYYNEDDVRATRVVKDFLVKLNSGS